MSRFGSDPQAFFENVYRGEAPWDIGGAQPDMVRLLADFPPRDPILDVGCGSGDLAVHLARLGYTVKGVDFVEAAIQQANKKRSELPAEIAERLQFHVGDASRPEAIGEDFGAVVDSGFFHVLDAEAADRFVVELARVLRPGGRYYIQAFAVDFGEENMPRAIQEEELRTRFTEEAGWRILAIRAVEFHSRVAPPVAALAACIERLG